MKKLTYTRDERIVPFAEVDIVYRSKVPASGRVKVADSRNVVALMRPLFVDCMEHHEEMYALFLNRANQAVAVICVGRGNVSGTVGNVKAIIQAAVMTNASAVVLAHNHPSGNTRPSDSDREMTRKVKEALMYVECNLLDHVILTEDAYLSFADEGLL